jgi:uncharacterized protein (TIGR00369 family)
VNEEAKLKAIDAYRQHSDCLPQLLGIQLIEVGQHSLTASLSVTPHHLNPEHSSCHAATMVALADTACGWGCIAHLPEGASSFTTIDLNCNLLRTVTDGVITCQATMLHGGRTTQIWDAIIHDGSGRKVSAFRCTELVLY